MLGVFYGFHRTFLDMCFRGEGADLGIETIAELPIMRVEDLVGSVTRRPHHGRGMNGRTPLQDFSQGSRAHQSRR